MKGDFKLASGRDGTSNSKHIFAVFINCPCFSYKNLISLVDAQILMSLALTAHGITIISFTSMTALKL
jgi:hypothetical protein